MRICHVSRYENDNVMQENYSIPEFKILDKMDGTYSLYTTNVNFISSFRYPRINRESLTPIAKKFAGAEQEG